jgi:uncharacterized membrane protein YdjX (TVP38/TMEM64 family)
MHRRLRNGLRLTALGAVLLLCGLAWHFGAGRASYWPALVAHRADWAADVARHPVVAPAIFVVLYAAAVTVSLPIGLGVSLLAGLLFGAFAGGVLTVISASLGAVALFLLARGLLAPLFAGRFTRRIAGLQQGLQRDGFSYLLALRLMPIFPFWLINLAPALIGMRLLPYASATVLGMIPSSFILSDIGAGLGATMRSGGAPSVGMLLTPKILLPLAALALLAALPAIWRQWKSRTALAATETTI